MGMAHGLPMDLELLHSSVVMRNPPENPLPDIIGNANEMRAPEIEMANVDSAYIAPAPEIQS